MHRALVLAALLVPASAVAAPAQPHSLPDLIAALADVAAHFDLPAPHVPALPDLRILTTEPVANTESSGFGWRDDPFRHDRRYHRGTDFRAHPGTPVLAAGDGVVVFAGRQSGYGNVIYVDHGGGVVTRYAHLRRIETKKNAPVTAGERIGQVGSTGRATGPHLHFEVRLDGRAVDPVTAMTVADLERQNLEAGRLAAFALVPQIQAGVRDATERPSAPHAARPERKGRVKRAQVLW